jgi:Ni2+-binding GTPase involved in maturation of urease and hydrogenase
MSQARYIMIGGFLGAGKTTSVAKLAQQLTAQGLKVGLITNDQGSELVDTAMLRSKGFATEEIPGGCFCCRFNSLVDAAVKLTNATRPDVFIAEPVGSCTDLVATVTYPLRRIYGEDFDVAPLSVLLDPIRALRLFGVEEGGRFSDKVAYIYRKQIEEADLIVINKADLLTPDREAALRAALSAEFPGKPTIAVSARTGQGIDEWFARISRDQQPDGESMQVDYEVYADGEALLGWLNCTVQLAKPDGFDGNELIRELATGIQTRLNAASGEIAHLKMTLSPDGGLGDIAVVNVVRNDFVPELSIVLPDVVPSGQLIINVRAEASPETLHTAVVESVAALAAAHPGLTAKLEHEEHFRPGKPQPTHRLTAFTAP